MSAERTRSLWWILLPSLLGIIGGIIAYFVLRYDDKKLGIFCLKLSIVLTVIEIAIYIPVLLLLAEVGQDFGVNI